MHCCQRLSPCAVGASLRTTLLLPFYSDSFPFPVFPLPSFQVVLQQGFIATITKEHSIFSNLYSAQRRISPSVSIFPSASPSVLQIKSRGCKETNSLPSVGSPLRCRVLYVKDAELISELEGIGAAERCRQGWVHWRGTGVEVGKVPHVLLTQNC